MGKIRCLLVSMLLVAVASALAVSEPTLQTSPPKEENSRDLFSLESTYTFNSDFRGNESKLGDGDSFYGDFSYDHRFLITGNWFFRAGVEYERFEFGGTDNGLPDHLQAAYGHLAVEYVVHNFPGAMLELDPGVYFQNHITKDTFDIPWKIFTAFPLQKDKVYGVIGFGGALYQNPIVAPGGGIIWLFSDKLRLEGVFPRPALVWEPDDNWQIRFLGELNYVSFRTDDVVTTMRKLQTHNAVVQYNEDRAGAQISFSGFKPFKITAGGGYTFIRDFDFFRHGVRVRAEPAPYFRLSIDAKF